jgi:hypothetical protein
MEITGGTRFGKAAFGLFGLTIMLFVLAVIPANSSASSIRLYNAFACTGNCQGSTVEAFVNKPFTLGIGFATTESIQNGDSISVRLPEGTKFDRITEVVGKSGNQSDRLPSTLSDDKRTLTMTLTDTFTPTTSGVLIIGRYEPMITAPAKPGPFPFQMWTSKDVDPYVSNLPLYISPAPGSNAPVLPVRIKSGPQGKISRSTVKFRFGVDFAIDRFECRLDERKWRKCKSPVPYRVRPGRHVFRVRAVASGTKGSVSKRIFTRVD